MTDQEPEHTSDPVAGSGEDGKLLADGCLGQHWPTTNPECSEL